MSFSNHIVSGYIQKIIAGKSDLGFLVILQEDFLDEHGNPKAGQIYQIHFKSTANLAQMSLKIGDLIMCQIANLTPCILPVNTPNTSPVAYIKCDGVKCALLENKTPDQMPEADEEIEQRQPIQRIN